jgi:CBS domain-containing protein
MFVKDAMSGNVRSCHKACNLEDAARLMWEYDCGSIPVVDQSEKPIGIVTDRDITIASMLNHQALWELNADTLVSKQTLISCHVDDQLEDCIKIMEKNSIRRLPVVNDMGFLTGILSMGDVIAFASNKFSKSKQSNVLSFNEVIAMLKQVSAHHIEPEMPITAM